MELTLTPIVWSLAIMWHPKDRDGATIDLYHRLIIQVGAILDTVIYIYIYTHFTFISISLLALSQAKWEDMPLFMGLWRIFPLTVIINLKGPALEL